MDRFDKDPSSERREGELPVGLRGVGMGLGNFFIYLFDFFTAIFYCVFKSLVVNYSIQYSTFCNLNSDYYITCFSIVIKP